MWDIGHWDYNPETQLSIPPLLCCVISLHFGQSNVLAQLKEQNFSHANNKLIAIDFTKVLYINANPVYSRSTLEIDSRFWNYPL